MKFARLFLLLTLAACTPLDPLYTFLAGEDQVDPGAPFMANSFNGNNANSGIKQTIVARTSAEWSALWQLLQQDMPGPLPKGKMAVAVLIGERPTGGHRVEIISVQRQNKLGDVEKLDVSWRELLPPPGTVQTQAVTSPWAVRLTDSWPFVPNFREQSSVTLPAGARN